MTRRDFLLAIALLLAGAPAAVRPRQPRKVPVIGRLSTSSAGPNSSVNEALRKGLRDLGYIEGRDFIMEHRSSKSRNEQLPHLADELVRLKVDVIVTGTDEATRAAKQATNTIPIVAILYNSPVSSGLIDSFNHPGGNITGIATRHTELVAKRLELLKEIVPGLTRVTVLSDALSSQELNQLKVAAPQLGIQLRIIELDVR